MDISSQTLPSPPTQTHKPRGILKNAPQQRGSADVPLSHVGDQVAPTTKLEEDAEHESEPGQSKFSEREIVQMNTEKNAGASRRNSSNPRQSLSRRRSDQNNGAGGDENGEGMPGVKWDEANLYLNEGQMGGKMKIDEPKTPFVREYDPDQEDETHTSSIDPQDIVVDELDQKAKGNQRTREMDIPGLDIGEPKIESSQHRNEQQRVLASGDEMDVDGEHKTEATLEDADQDHAEKHRRFEEARKKHYEMKNVKNLLGHPLPDPDAE